MEIINYTEARQNFSATMDKACENHVPIAITRKNGKAVVMLSLDDYNSWQETLYLLQSEANRKRLLQSVQNVKKGKYQKRDLIGDEE